MNYLFTYCYKKQSHTLNKTKARRREQFQNIAIAIIISVVLLMVIIMVIIIHAQKAAQKAYNIKFDKLAAMNETNINLIKEDVMEHYEMLNKIAGYILEHEERFKTIVFYIRKHNEGFDNVKVDIRQQNKKLKRMKDNIQRQKTRLETRIKKIEYHNDQTVKDNWSVLSIPSSNKTVKTVKHEARKRRNSI
jgi:hypothetical protein